MLLVPALTRRSRDPLPSRLVQPTSHFARGLPSSPDCGNCLRVDALALLDSHDEVLATLQGALGLGHPALTRVHAQRLPARGAGPEPSMELATLTNEGHAPDTIPGQ